MLACLLLTVDIQSLYCIICNFLIEVLKTVIETSVTICIVHPIPWHWLRDRSEKATRASCVPHSHPMQTWFQLPKSQALSCCSSERAMHRHRKHLCCPKPNQPLCTALAQPLPIHLSHPTPYQAWSRDPCAVPASASPDSQLSVSWCILPNVPSKAARSSEQSLISWITPSSTGCCHCPSSGSVLALVPHHAGLCGAAMEAPGTH